ncbi:hypothetical protein JCM21714_4368 [Gracilibacillus boraciitolerans JCM 21714]|uniref:DUF1659 domain-containing protein n=1 Tax=Gracilibacillus boraciitolerans JCM 21714 TaxID=1298598 RepID=W4VPQ9_9BACI|nr:DUF1659 domain-containing protein [Gracilibacillus boraciitolerans]GAE95156.1 hypothetical protein JCM21714_4368 [Gracilibacillus boraciitolerans JCM 21714]
MALAERIDSRLQLTFENGMDPITGDAIYKLKSFNNVKLDATADQLLAITAAITPLQQLVLYSVKRNDTELITED